MATTFDEIYDRFLSKITDYELAALANLDLTSNLKKYLKNAVTDFVYCKQNLSDRDDAHDTFNIDITEMEQSILAKFMIVQWINPQLLRLENIRNELGNKDFQLFSPANFLEKLTALKTTLIKEAVEDMVFYHYNSISD